MISIHRSFFLSSQHEKEEIWNDRYVGCGHFPSNSGKERFIGIPY